MIPLTMPTDTGDHVEFMPRIERETSSSAQIIYLWGEQHSFPTRYTRANIDRALDEALRRLFDRYANEWYTATVGLSSAAQKKSHPAYNEILSLGPDVIKFMLEDFEQTSPSPHWFSALKALSGDDPVPDDRRGNVSEMKRAWIEWGRNKKYL